MLYVCLFVNVFLANNIILLSFANSIDQSARIRVMIALYSVVECLTRDQRAAGSSLTGVTALWSLSKTQLSWLSTGSTQEDLSLFNLKIVDET